MNENYARIKYNYFIKIKEEFNTMERFSRPPVGNSRTESTSMTFLNQVYAWMASGLLITAVVAYVVANSMELLLFSFQYRWILFIAQLGLVFVLAGRINTLSHSAATGMFLIYSALMGMTLSGILVIYTSESIASVFVITAGTFGAMSLYGYTTKRDLSGMGSMLFMALLGIIIASFVNFFLRSEGLMWLLTYAGVFIFVALTAYDTQKLKKMAEQFAGDEEATKKFAIFGALTLYLDFLNLFLYLLRIFGKRR